MHHQRDARHPPPLHATAPAGVQVDTWDDPDLTPDDTPAIPRINPLTGLPE